MKPGTRVKVGRGRRVFIFTWEREGVAYGLPVTELEVLVQAIAARRPGIREALEAALAEGAALTPRPLGPVGELWEVAP